MSQGDAGKTDGPNGPKKPEPGRKPVRPPPAGMPVPKPAVPGRSDPPGRSTRPPTAKTASDSRIQLGPYRLLEKIGAGGMGTVYRAVHVELDREVALKVLPAQLASNPTMVARFKREAKAAAQLQHENIVQIHDVSEEKGTHFIALEFIRGSDLHDLITKKKHLSLKEAIDYLKQATLALDHAFQKGIVHRDIKPSNFLITKEGGKVKLCDMGLALRTDAGDESKITRDGSTVGTVDYMAPEQARDSRLADTRSDIYSLGCTFYQMLTGRVPFEEGTIPEKLFKHATEPPPDILQFNPDVPPQIRYVLSRMLEKKQEDRYQTPAELLKELNSLELDERPQQAELKTLAIGAEEDEQKPEGGVVLSRRHSVAEKQKLAERAQQAQRKKLFVIGGAVAAAVGIIGLVIFFIIAGGGERPKVEPSVIAKNDPNHKNTPPTTSGSHTAISPSTTANTAKNGSASSGSNNAQPTKNDAQPTSDTKNGGSETNTVPPRDESTAGADTHLTTTRPGSGASSPITNVTPKNAASAADIEKAKRDFGSRVPETRLVVPGTVEVGRVPGEQKHIFASLSAACKSSQTTGFRILVGDNGPLVERSFVLQDRDVSVNPKSDQTRKYRPLIIVDPSASGGPARPFFIQSKNCDLEIEGVDFVLNASQLKSALGSTAKYAIFEPSGDLVLKDCTFSILGDHAGEISIVRATGARKEDPARAPTPRLAQIAMRGCYVRGSFGLRAVTVANAVADVEISDSLVVVDQGPVIDLQPPQDLTISVAVSRSLRCLRSTFISRRDFLAMTGGATKGYAVDVRLVDTIVAGSGASTNKRLVRVTDWNESAKQIPQLKWTEGGALYTGWDSLVQIGIPAKVLADSHDKWREVWGVGPDGSTVRKEPWPTVDAAEIPYAAKLRFDPSEPAAGITSRLGEPFIGCQLDRLPGERVHWRALVEGTIEAPRLLDITNLAPQSTMDAGKNPLLGRWQAAQERRRREPEKLADDDKLDSVFVTDRAFNVETDGDLGKYLAGFAAHPELTIALRVQGTKSRPMTPVRLAGKSLVLWFESPDDSLAFYAAPDAAPAEALFDIRDGDLVIQNGDFTLPTGAAAAKAPPRFIQVERGNLTLVRCRLVGPIIADPKVTTTFRELVRYVGSSQKTGGPVPVYPKPNQTDETPIHLDFHPSPHPTVTACQFVDCLLASSVRCVAAEIPNGILRFSNCVGVAPDLFLSAGIEGARVDSFLASILLEHNTIAASKSVVQIGRWEPVRPAERPLTVFSSDNLFCDPFDFSVGAEQRRRMSVVLRYDSPTLEQGMLLWHGSNDGFTRDIHSYVLRDAFLPTGKQRYQDDWEGIWGKQNQPDNLADETAGGDKIRLRGGRSVRLREFTRRDLVNLLILDNCPAYERQLGADLSRAPFFVVDPNRRTSR